MTRAAVYVRISSDREGTNLGVERQELDCRELCENKGWEVIEPVYVDNNKTAADPSKPRPQYDHMMRDVSAGKVDAVVVYVNDRLHRQPMELEQFVEACKAAGMRTLASVKSGEVDLSDPNALMVLRIQGSVAANEVDRTRYRIQRKQRELAETGKSHGGGRRAFGWERGGDSRDGSTVNEYEAALIREAAERVLRGESLRSITMDFRRREIPTVSGSPWKVNSVKSFLRSPRNAGLRQYRGEVIGEADWPAILDRETFERLQVIFSDPTRQVRGPHRHYPLSGVLTCGVCHKRLMAMPRKKPIPSDPDRRVRYYGCRTDAGGCGKIFVTAEHVEREVIGPILSFVDDPELRQITSAERGIEASEMRELVQQNAQDGQTLAELEDAFATGDLSRSGLQRNSKVIKERMEHRSARLTAIQGTSALDRFSGRISENWGELTSEEQRSVILSLISSVEVMPKARGGFNTFDPKRIAFHWRWGALARWAEGRDFEPVPGVIGGVFDSEGIPLDG